VARAADFALLHFESIDVIFHLEAARDPNTKVDLIAFLHPGKKWLGECAGRASDNNEE
jgi:hypothetical protein